MYVSMCVCMCMRCSCVCVSGVCGVSVCICVCVYSACSWGWGCSCLCEWCVCSKEGWVEDTCIHVNAHFVKKEGETRLVTFTHILRMTHGLTVCCSVCSKLC